MKHLSLCLLTAFLSLPEMLVAQSGYARKGILDLNQRDFQTQGTVSLTGEWEFYMSELISPTEFAKQKTLAKDYIDFPSLWNEHSQAIRPGDGYATYRLKVVVLPARELALEIPHFYSNYTLWINSRVVASNGTVGITEKTSVPQWLPQTITFRAEADTLDIVIHASNFHHAKGGVREAILLGNVDELTFKRQISIMSSLALFGSLLVIALGFIVIFLFFKRDVSLLYAAVLCVTWAMRAMFSNQYVANTYFPDFPWEFCVKIEYFTLYLVMIGATLFLSSIFKNDVNVPFKYMFCGLNGIFVAVTLLFKASLYTRFLPVYLSFCAVLLIYIIYVLIRAWVHEREGAWLMISCMFLGVILFAYDLFSYQVLAAFNPIILNFGYLLMFVLVAICLMNQLGIMKKSPNTANMLTYEEMFSEKELKR